MCCGGCNGFLTNNINHIWEVTDQHMETTDLVFPVLAPSAATTLFGYHFLPVVETPVVYYITERAGEPLSYLCFSI